MQKPEVFDISDFEVWEYAVGKSEAESGCSGGWIEYWRTHAGAKDRVLCSEVDCLNEGTIGGHVTNESWHGRYIVPVCPVHNVSPGKTRPQLITKSTLAVKAVDGFGCP